MTVNTESLDGNSSSESRSAFYCPESPHLTWDLNHTTSLKIIVPVTTIACPVTFLLNLLVIIAVKTRRELKRDSNILLSRLAVTDVLVGVVSLPLTITLDSLVLQRILFEDVICTLNSVSVFALHTLYAVSFLHLLLIAWERYVVMVNWMKYKAIVSRERVNKYVRIAWLAALLTVNPQKIMKAAGVRYEITIIVEVAVILFWGACLFLIAYFYANAYIGVRKWSRIQLRTSSGNSLFRTKLERRIFRTASWLTFFAGIFGITAAVVYFVSPSPSYSFRWSQTILQLNSLFNPLLYFYRNRQLRKAALGMLRCRKPQRIQPVAHSVSRNKQRRHSVASVDVEQLQIGQKRPRLTRSTRRRSNETLKERPASAPSKMENDEPSKVLVTVQHENAPRKKRIQRKTISLEDATKLELKPRHHTGGKLGRSTSLHENSFVNATEKNFLRSRSLPILSTNVNARDKN